jgi:hypothetical protein
MNGIIGVETSRVGTRKVVLYFSLAMLVRREMIITEEADGDD